MEDINTADDLKQFEKEVKEKIISDLGFDEATEEQKQELISNLDERISISFMKTILSNIEEADGSALLEKIEKEEEIDQDIEKILAKYPDLNDQIQADLESLYEKMLEEAKEIWQTIIKE